MQQSGRLALRWQWRAASALSAGAGGDADHIARFLSLALPLDLQGQWSALCTHQIAAWRAPISRTGSRLIPTMTATMPKFSRQARVRTFDEIHGAFWIGDSIGIDSPLGEGNDACGLLC